MLWALLPMLFFLFIFGFTAIERDMETITPPAAPFGLNQASEAAQDFMIYRNAVINYAQQQLSTQGKILAESIPYNALASYLLPSGIRTLPTGAQAIIAPQANGLSGYNICIWMPAPAGTIGQAMKQSDGDLTIGTVKNNGYWFQTAPGGSLQQIPCSLSGVNQPSSGYIISVVGLEVN